MDLRIAAGVRLIASRMRGLDAVWLLMGAVVAAALFVPPANVGNDRSLRSFATPPVTSRYSMAQRFTMNRPGLAAVEIRAVATGESGGRYRLALRDRTAARVDRVVDVPASALTEGDSYVFRFEPIPESTGRNYQLEISASPDAPGHGVALMATKGTPREGGELQINETTRWATLVFQTHTRTPPPSLFRALVSAADGDRPPLWLAVIGLVGSWVALRFLLRTVAPAPAGAVRFVDRS